MINYGHLNGPCPWSRVLEDVYLMGEMAFRNLGFRIALAATSLDLPLQRVVWVASERNTPCPPFAQRNLPPDPG